MRKRESEWSYRLSPPEIAEIETAGRAVQARGLEIVNIRREDFPLPTLGPTLERMRAEVLDGRGFILSRGMPVEGRPIAESATAYWGIGTYVGGARSQSAQGHLLGHVYDFAGGLSATNPNLRSYATAERQNFHIDHCDVVALLCLRRAKSGGLSSIISSMTVHNTMAAIMAAIMAARRPDLLDRLYQPFAVDRRGEVPEGKAPFYEAPVFNEHTGYLSVLYSRLHIGSAQRFPDARRLTAEDTEALDMFGELAGDPELRLDMNFMPGDIQFLHNHTILHARSAYEDWPKVERKRHLLRLWLAPQAPGRFHRSSRNATPTSRSEIAAASSARELVCTYCWRRARTSRRRLGWGDGRSAARAGSPKHLQSSSSATVRQTHIDGDKLCQIRWRHVPATIDRLTGNTGPAHIFVRRHGRHQLHLCRGELDPGAGRLDRRPHPSLRGNRRGDPLRYGDPNRLGRAGRARQDKG